MVLTVSKTFVIMLWLHISTIMMIVQWHFVNSWELQAFKEHLDFNHLKHATILRTMPPTSLAAGSTKEQSALEEDKFGKSLLNQLISQYYLGVVNGDNNKKDFRQFFHRNTPRVGLFMHYTPTDQRQQNILRWASENEKFNYSSSWFIVMEDNNNGEHLAFIRQAFGHLNVMLNADVTVAFKKGNCTLDLYDIYKICHKCGSPLEVEYKGNWTAQQGLGIREKFRDHFVTRRNNFKNTTVDVATALLNYSPDLEMTPLDYLDNNKRYLQNDFMQRKTYQLMKITQSLYNYTFHLQILDKWGAFTNGSWTGVLALLQSHNIEFSLCPIRFTIERARAISFSPEVHVETVLFLLRHPKRSSIRNIFFEPLAATVWWCVLALIVITAFLLALHVRAEYQLYWKLQRHAGTGEQETHGTQPHLDFVVLTILEAIFMQGPSPQQFRSNSTRLLLTSVSVFSILLMQFYGAFIVSSLLSEPPRTITTLSALYNSSLQIGMENIYYNFELFNTTTSQVVRNIYKNRICRRGTNQIVSLDQGVQRIARGGFALHVSTVRAYRLLAGILTESQFCDLQEITFNTPFTTSLGLSRTSPYNKFISTAILKFRETSLLQYNNRLWEIPKIDCMAVSKDDVEVDLAHFAPVLVFLAFAILTSAWIFVAEHLYKRIRGRIHVSCENICKTMRKYLANKQ